MRPRAGRRAAAAALALLAATAAAETRIDYVPAPAWPAGLREAVQRSLGGRRPAALVLGASRIEVPRGATVGVQVDRVVRDIHWTPSAFDASVPPARVPSGPEQVVPYMEGRLAAELMRYAGVTLQPLTPAVVKLDPRQPGYGHAADAEGAYRFLVDSSKIAYATARPISPGLVELPDTHGFSAVAAEGARRRPFLVMACMDTPAKAAGALDLAGRGIHAYGPTDRFGYELLGYRVMNPQAGVVLGSAPIRPAPGGGATIGGQPVEIRLEETIVAQWTDRQSYPWQYSDSAWRYFAALDALYGLGLRLVKVEADAGALEKLIEVARARGADVVAVRVGKASSEDETAHDAAVLSRWLAESPRHRAVLFHTAAYEAGYKLFFDFPAQTTFGDLDPRLR